MTMTGVGRKEVIWGVSAAGTPRQCLVISHPTTLWHCLLQMACTHDGATHRTNSGMYAHTALEVPALNLAAARKALQP